MSRSANAAGIRPAGAGGDLRARGVAEVRRVITQLLIAAGGVAILATMFAFLRARNFMADDPDNAEGSGAARPRGAAAREHIEQTLREQEDKFASILDSLVDSVITIDHRGIIQSVNASVTKLFGYSAEEMVGSNVSMLMPPHYAREHARYIANYLTTGQRKVLNQTRTLEAQRKDGTTFPMELSVTESTYHGARIFTGIIRDITERRRNEESLRESERKLRAILTTLVDGVVAIDYKGIIQDVNPAALDIFGYRRDEMIGRNVRMLMPPRYANEHDSYVAHYLATGERKVIGRTRQLEGQRKNGTTFPLELSVSESSVGGVRIYTGVVRDVTERLHTERTIRRMALEDPLTGLPNRGQFRERLADAINQADRSKGVVGLLLLDLDNFKDVNDTLGHPIGDLLLKEAAQRIAHCARKTDIVARLGGDEFAVIATLAQNVHNILVLADRIVGRLSEPFVVDGHEVRTGTSIGITVYPTDSSSVDQLVSNADTALYRAKADGRGTYQLFDEAMNREIQERRSLELDLRSSIEREEFVLYYQPQLDLSNGLIVGAEALLRWNHPKRGFLPPGAFISIAESTGLIIPISSWVLTTACRDAVSWASRTNTKEPLSVAINLSPLHFRRDFLVDEVRTALKDSGLAPEKLTLEITESMVMGGGDDVVEMLDELKALGVRIEIDDFGTGFSSLSYIKRFPVDGLKIDRSFVSEIEEKWDSAAICHSVIQLGHSLNLKIVGEGVETRAQLERLIEEGCDLAQGYLFSEPLDGEAFVALVQNHDPSAYRALCGPKPASGVKPAGGTRPASVSAPRKRKAARSAAR
jgi:diguanylate cyclase (GGDEF)-like protein/PAS domain S-box-containing protein